MDSCTSGTSAPHLDTTSNFYTTQLSPTWAITASRSVVDGWPAFPSPPQKVCLRCESNNAVLPFEHTFTLQQFPRDYMNNN